MNKHYVVTVEVTQYYVVHCDGATAEQAKGYAKRLRHGTIGKGLNDYDAIFGTLRAVGFDGWVSIEDGVDGMEQLAESVRFVRAKLRQHWAGF